MCVPRVQHFGNYMMQRRVCHRQRPFVFNVIIDLLPSNASGERNTLTGRRAHVIYAVSNGALNVDAARKVYEFVKPDVGAD